MIYRYEDRDTFNNNDIFYKELLESRNVNKIKQYSSPTMSYPSEEVNYNLYTKQHIWTVGDRYYKLSHKYYGDVNDWWIIAGYNKKPTEAHVFLGDILYIPFPLHEVIKYLKG